MINGTCRGVRGATGVAENSEAAILRATRDLLQQVIAANGIEVDDIASIFFTATTDLNAAYPAIAARQLGWTHIPLLCGQEIDVQGGMGQVVRVLLHWNTSLTARQIQHVYINGAERLRPDLVTGLHPVEGGQR
jgi:chorismate mutase